MNMRNLADALLVSDLLPKGLIQMSIPACPLIPRKYGRLYKWLCFEVIHRPDDHPCHPLIHWEFIAYIGKNRLIGFRVLFDAYNYSLSE